MRRPTPLGGKGLGGNRKDGNPARAGGGGHGELGNRDELEKPVAPLGRTLVQRTTLYGPVEEGHRLEVTRRDDGRALLPVVGA